MPEIAMKKLSNLITISILSTFLLGQVGQIAGVVSSDNEGLAGANVILEGTPYGTAANVAGEYYIENIPAGDYTVTVTYVGYANESQEVTINAGEELQKGQVVARVGETGKSQGPHLHFEIWKNNQVLDPREIIPIYKEKDVSIRQTR